MYKTIHSVLFIMTKPREKQIINCRRVTEMLHSSSSQNLFTFLKFIEDIKVFLLIKELITFVILKLIQRIFKIFIY